MTQEQLESLNLGLPNDAETLLMVESAVDWLIENTTLSVDKEDLSELPAGAKLFLVKFSKTLSRDQSISSESIESLSQSFRETGADELLWSIADALLGPYLKGRVRFVPATKAWIDD